MLDFCLIFCYIPSSNLTIKRKAVYVVSANSEFIQNCQDALAQLMEFRDETQEFCDENFNIGYSYINELSDFLKKRTSSTKDFQLTLETPDQIDWSFYESDKVQGIQLRSIKNFDYITNPATLRFSSNKVEKRSQEIFKKSQFTLFSPYESKDFQDWQEKNNKELTIATVMEYCAGAFPARCLPGIETFRWLLKNPKSIFKNKYFTPTLFFPGTIFRDPVFGAWYVLACYHCGGVKRNYMCKYWLGSAWSNGWFIVILK